MARPPVKTPSRPSASKPAGPAAAAAPNPPYCHYTGQASARYVSPPAVAEIVNLAVHLGRPLLVEGEAGCGKTQLAHAVAEELGLADRMVPTTVKSTSQAKDLLYRFDALRRLQEVQAHKARAARVAPYITLQPLGRAILRGEPAVVLIDEIDKADIDFPNDLLDVLDRFQFEIDDLPDDADEVKACMAQHGHGRVVRAPQGGVRPIVVITSNREKQLPEPFLRRCLYVKLEFPSDAAMLREIVRRNLAATGVDVADRLVEAAVVEFMRIRTLALQRGLQKPPATSELVDWVRALHWQQRASDTVAADGLGAGDRAILFKVQRDLERWQAGLDAVKAD